MAADSIRDGLIKVEQLDEGLYALSDPLDFRCYLVVGTRRAALVDTMGGFGNVREVVGRLAGGLPVTALLTHRHIDHASGAYFFEEVMMSAEEDGHWEELESQAREHMANALAEGVVPADAPWSVRDGSRPHVTYVAEGDVIELGGRHLEVVALPGHTVGSMGYLCPELRALFSGDAVTPVMCLCFPESLDIDEWRQTIAKMQTLDFERFYTGHHEHAFGREDLVSFDEAAAFALTDRGIEWHHTLIEAWEGTCHFCPCPTDDVESVDFRAVITKGLPPQRKRRRRREE